MFWCSLGVSMTARFRFYRMKHDNASSKRTAKAGGLAPYPIHTASYSTASLFSSTKTSLCLWFLSETTLRSLFVGKANPPETDVSVLSLLNDICHSITFSIENDNVRS